MSGAGGFSSGLRFALPLSFGGLGAFTGLRFPLGSGL